jgi:hypothetical protein
MIVELLVLGAILILSIGLALAVATSFFSLVFTLTASGIRRTEAPAYIE